MGRGWPRLCAFKSLIQPPIALQGSNKFAWAMAGRSQQRLEQVRQELTKLSPGMAVRAHGMGGGMAVCVAMVVGCMTALHETRG